MTTITQLERRPAGGGAPRVVVGAGFGGLAAVRSLARAGMRTTLIDRNVYATFQPLLYQLATGGPASSDVAYPVRAISHRYGAEYRHGELAGVDPTARRITLADGTALRYDYLILATGAAAGYHGIPGGGRAHPGPVHPARRHRPARPHRGDPGPDQPLRPARRRHADRHRRWAYRS
jgi:NADPH-dependent 2,4-dienoyl-CoA reductase/sulfur reductase-like enzyme